MSQVTAREADTAPRHRETAVQDAPVRAIRWFPVLSIAVLLIVFNTGWIANSEMKTLVTEISISSLFLGVTFILFVTTLLNLLVRRIAGAGVALCQPELMLIYSMLSLSSVVAGVGHLGFFAPFLTNVFWFANDSNGYRSLWGLLPRYMGPRDPDVLKGFYTGHAALWEPNILRAWSFPLAVWTGFFLILLWMTLCLAVIVRKRWSDQEHLPFPVVMLPLQMTEDGGPIYRQPLLWAGFLIPCFFHSLNSLNSIIPSLPSLPINSARDLAIGLQFPWNGIQPIFGGIHPAGVGFGYLINTDVLFSLWFFYMVRKSMNLLGVVFNWRDVGGGQFGDGGDQFPFVPYQAAGAWLTLGVAILWQGRDYFAGYFRRAFRGDPDRIDAGEPMSARAAVVGFCLGFLALCVFIWSSGGSWWLPVLVLLAYVLIMVTLTRLQAETAVLSPYLSWVDPQSILVGALGSHSLGSMDAVHLGMMSWFNTDYRAAAMPHQLQAFVGQDRARGDMRPVPMALLFASAVALVSGLLWDLQLYYSNGAGTGNVNAWRISVGTHIWQQTVTWIQHPESPKPHALLGMVIGAGITLVLTYLRGRFTGFPLAPAAYVLNMSWANDLFWLDMLIAWICKVVLLRYFGWQSYKKALPFFLGLILGDFVTGSLWSIVGMMLKMELFRTFST